MQNTLIRESVRGRVLLPKIRSVGTQISLLRSPYRLISFLIKTIEEENRLSLQELTPIYRTQQREVDSIEKGKGSALISARSNLQIVHAELEPIRKANLPGKT